MDGYINYSGEHPHVITFRTSLGGYRVSDWNRAHDITPLSVCILVNYVKKITNMSINKINLFLGYVGSSDGCMLDLVEVP